MTKELVIVDFILAVEPEAHREPAPPKLRLMKCGCGSEEFSLASEMTPDAVKGIPASRMYECTACGEYRLG